MSGEIFLGRLEDNADTDEFISLTVSDSSVPLAWAMPTLTLRSLRQTALALTQHFDLLMCLHVRISAPHLTSGLIFLGGLEENA